MADLQAPPKMQRFIDVYGDSMRQKHRDCQNCCVLIKMKKNFQCGLILASGPNFAYVLTTETSALHNTGDDFIITFGDGTETNFNANSVVVHSGSKLAILFICGGIEGVKDTARQPVRFSDQDKMEEAVVYTLSYIPASFYELNRQPIQCAPATSYFRGGNIGIADLQHEGTDVFYHNCSAGRDITNGSVVLNGSCEVIGMNLEHSAGWTMSLCLNKIKDEITGIFPGTHKTLAGIREYLEAKGADEANKTNF